MHYVCQALHDFVAAEEERLGLPPMADSENYLKVAEEPDTKGPPSPPVKPVKYPLHRRPHRNHK